MVVGGAGVGVSTRLGVFPLYGPLGVHTQSRETVSAPYIVLTDCGTRPQVWGGVIALLSIYTLP